MYLLVVWWLLGFASFCYKYDQIIDFYVQLVNFFGQIDFFVHFISHCIIDFDYELVRLRSSNITLDFLDAHVFTMAWKVHTPH